jgi:beta-mannosidase
VRARATIDLCGAWRLGALASSATSAPLPIAEVEARVPGCVHTDLERVGLVAPLARDGDGPAVDWIGRTAWRFERLFVVDAVFASAARLELVFESLQGRARVSVDGTELGLADNQFRTWRFDVSGLAPGEHTLAVEFDDVMSFLAAKNAERRLPAWGVGQDKDDSGAWLRVSPVMFGWDFAPRAVTCGIAGPVRLEAPGDGFIAHVALRQRHRASGGVSVDVTTTLRDGGAGSTDDPHVELVLTRHGARIASTRGAPGAVLELVVDAPELWWPNGEGAQPLYDLDVRVCAPSGVLLDRTTRRVGLRTLELVRERSAGHDGEEESFTFRVNGRDLSIRGANWVPPQLHDAAEDAAHVERLVARAAAAGFDMLRVWGGGPYASEAFFDACDRHGLLVWQDMPFACATYPTFDDAFLANVEAELRDQCARLHHRASLALLCGNNELENGLVEDEWTDLRMAWRDYSRLFDELAPRVVRAWAPDTPWWPGSPHSPLHDRMKFNDERSGDAHTWEVWHAEAPFESALDRRHRFLSEFGFQSPPHPQRLAPLVGGDVSANAPRVAHRQRSLRGDERIDRYLAREGIDAARLEPSARSHLVRLLQALGDGLAMEHARRAWPRCGGFLVWQWNEPWLAPSWSLVDAAGEPKPAFEAARRAGAIRFASLWWDSRRARVFGALVDHGPNAGGAFDWRLVAHDLCDEGAALELTRGRSSSARGTLPLFEVSLGELRERTGRAADATLLTLDVRHADGRVDENWLVPAPLGAWRTAPAKVAVLGVAPRAAWSDARRHARGERQSRDFVLTVVADRPTPFPLVVHSRTALTSTPTLACLPAGRPVRLAVRADVEFRHDALENDFCVLSLHDLVAGARTLPANT